MADVAALILTASGGPFLDATPAELVGGDARAGAPAPDLDDGREDHDRLGDAREQGPGGHRGALAVRCRLRRHRGRHPPAERRPLGRPLRGRLPQGPAGHPGHATSHPVRADLSRPPALAGGAARPDRHRAGSTSARPTTTRFPALRIAREAGRLGPRASAALIAADEVAVARFLDGTLGFTGIPRLLEAAVERFGGDGAAEPGRRGAGRPRCARSARRSRRGPIGARGMTGFVQSIITIVLFIGILGVLVVIHELGHFVDRPAGQRPRARVRDRLPAAGQGPALEGRDALHAQLAADRRVREARGRGRRPRPTTRARSPRRGCSTKLWILVAGVVMNLLLAFVDLHRHRAGSATRTIGRRVRGGPARFAGGGGRPQAAATSIVGVDGQRLRSFNGGPTADRRSASDAGETVTLGDRARRTARTRRSR